MLNSITMSKENKRKVVKSIEDINPQAIPFEKHVTGNEASQTNDSDQSQQEESKPSMNDGDFGLNNLVAESKNQVSQNLEFDIKRRIFLQMHEGNIYHVFGYAIILPSKYIENRAFTDTQSRFGDLLTISNGYIEQLYEDHILIELNIHSSEISNMHVEGSVAFTQSPIPISRVKAVHVSSEEKKKKIYLTAKTADGGIIPETLIHASFPEEMENIPAPTSPRIAHIDLSKEILKFDRILGAFAYLRNFSWLMVNRTGTLSVIPSHFYYMANAISAHKVFRQVSDLNAERFYQQLFGITSLPTNPVLSWLIARLQSGKNFTDVDTREFYQIFIANLRDIESKTTTASIFKRLADSLQRKIAIKEIWESSVEHKNQLFIFSILRQYANSDTEDRSISRNALPELLSTDQNIGQYVFGSLGYFYGYRLLRNFEEKIKVDDEIISSVARLNSPFPLKFELKTVLDYTIIEAVYSRVFNASTDNKEFRFETYPSLQKDEFPDSPSLRPDYEYSSGDLLGKYIFTIRHKTPIDDAIESVHSLSGDVPVVSDLGVYLLRCGVPKNWIGSRELLSRPNSWVYIVSFSKEQITESLRSGRIEAEEVIRRVGITRKYNEM
jgi:hypothetical protein